MIQIKKGYADCSGGQLHYHEIPNEGPTIVFLHQTASSGKMYYDVMGRLTNVHSIALDTPGFGGSFDPADMPSMSQYGEWVVECLNSLGIENFHLFGHHTGACIAAEIYAKVRERVQTCMMIGPVPLTKEERDEFRKSYSTPFAPDANGEYLKTTWDYLAGLGADSNVELHHREFVDTCRAYLGRFKAYSAVWDQDFTALFQEIKCPLLLMCAPDDVLIEYLSRAKDMQPQAQSVLLKGANFEPDQDPDGTANAIKDFLNLYRVI